MLNARCVRGMPRLGLVVLGWCAGMTAAPPCGGQPAAPGKQGDPRVAGREGPPVEPGPYVKQGGYEHWALRTRVQIYQKSWREAYQFPFETLTVVFPLIPATASSTPRRAEAEGRLDLGGPPAIEGKFLPPGATVRAGEYPHPPEVLERAFSGALYHSGTALAKFAVGELGVPRTTQQVSLTIDLPMTTANTFFDEERALAVPWPKGAWPEVAQSTFEPQRWVDYQEGRDGTVRQYSDKVFQTLIDRWLNGQDPKKDFTPVGLAKVLMGGIVTDIKPAVNWYNFEFAVGGASGGGASSTTTPDTAATLIGLQLRGAEYAARAADGASEWDEACLAAAVFRRCGLPTRLVIGFDEGRDTERDKEKQRQRERAGLRDQKLRLRSWVEFYLYDEANRTGNWVICDSNRLRKSAGKPPPLERPWKFFGTHDEMAEVLPFAFGFAPPTDVKSYSATGFWGWLVTPESPRVAYPALRFDTRKTAVPKDAPRETVNQGNPFPR